MKQNFLLLRHYEEMTLDPSISKEQTLNRLVEEYQGMLLKICYVYLKDAEQAKDAVQETYFKAYRALPSFRHICSEKNWLIRIAFNTCKSMQRSARFRYNDKRITPDQLPMAAPIQTNEPERMCDIMALPPQAAGSDPAALLAADRGAGNRQWLIPSHPPQIACGGIFAFLFRTQIICHLSL